MIKDADVVLGLSYGDEGKGKITHILSSKNKYDFCLRVAGGANAGHTIYHNGVKFVTHIIPSGVFYGIPGIIGSGCVLNVKQFFDEVSELKNAGIDLTNKLFIAENCHIVQDKHLQEEANETKVGTTKRGIGPAYRDKYAREGLRAKDIPELKPYIVDLYSLFYDNDNELNLLCEGAQGFNLDIDWGDYPYVTSSHTTIAGVIQNGITPFKVRSVYGIIKAYDTYVGAKRFEEKDSSDSAIFQKMRDLGNEYGATTGRPRQCNWLDLDKAIKATRMNGVTYVCMNKMDILDQIGVYKYIHNGEVVECSSKDEFLTNIKNLLKHCVVLVSYGADKDYELCR